MSKSIRPLRVDATWFFIIKDALENGIHRAYKNAHMQGLKVRPFIRNEYGYYIHKGYDRRPLRMGELKAVLKNVGKWEVHNDGYILYTRGGVNIPVHSTDEVRGRFEPKVVRRSCLTAAQAACTSKSVWGREGDPVLTECQCIDYGRFGGETDRWYVLEFPSKEMMSHFNVSVTW